MLNFWNGNKSLTRQQHELDVLRAVLQAQQLPYDIVHDATNYPLAADEANIFAFGTDLTTTVAGNLKFAKGTYLMVPHAICGGILGCRVLIVRRDEQDQFAQLSLSELQQRIAGIPGTWADAELLRQNGFKVLEQGTLAQQFLLLQEGLCDFIPLGINEAQSLLDAHSHETGRLAIEPSQMLYYPLPIVFYVHPAQPQLQEVIQKGLLQIDHNGGLERLYQKHYGESVLRMNPKQRKVIPLVNKQLSDEWNEFKPMYLE
ncbi:substrate-binding periplasmic protein [Vibrio cholerae]|uniref:substrate-binding periplasmic protein n=1 Tax=Vibrio cholerae TaxID=666 RepID=UPI000C9B2D8C|nr:transporter substrate-binding domain-containing protein [Vibrio cholerae]EGQ9611784.1 transporter substrate-binding domain-containing protein [Vibrio cholerae]EIJ0934179.1 transporter substrate-binding domain-containing protein [Vibrio cholerae]EKF9133470.1 transporter substrate-binding domain-containing protein [Vibrio cholerae]QKU58006.1 transporter substrate-binding domain-containing protein [Vibrio cholerae]